MKRNRLFVVFPVVIFAMLAISGFISVEYAGVLPDSFVAISCIVVLLLTLIAVLVGSFYAKKFSFTDLIPIIALAALIILVNLSTMCPVRKAPQGTPVNNSNVSGGKNND